MPATNFDDGINLNSQLIGALKYYTRNTVDATSYLYGTGWSESATNFVSKSSEFVLDVIMLAKQWIKGIQFGHKHIPSLSYMTELIVVFANRGKDESCLRIGFVRFLELIAEFNQIDIEFNDYKWLHQDLGMMKLRHSVPRILDPINMWHNVADKFYEINRVKIMRAARLTLDKLKSGADLIELLKSRNYNFA